MKLASWLRGADAAKEDLEQQRDGAKRARTEAWAAVDLAQAAFDADGSPATEKALVAARAEAERADLHLGRAERLLVAHNEAEEARKRADLEKHRDELTHELSDAALAEQRRPLAEREAALLIELAQLRAKRRSIEISVRNKAHELARTKQALGETVPSTSLDLFSLVPSQAVVRERLETFVAAQPQGDEAARYASRLADQLTGSLV